MNLNVLRNFIAVVEAGSIREAADNLHIAQSALSRQILALEREFGSDLLVRLPRGVEPTPAGRVVVRQARLTLDQMQDAREEIASFDGLRKGLIRLAAIEPFASGPLATSIARFRVGFPGISLDVRVGNSRQVATLVQEGIAELGVVYNAPRERGITARLSVRQPLVALARPGHPVAARRELTLADLAQWPAILPPDGSPTRVMIEEAARRAGLRIDQVMIESDCVALRLAVAMETDGIAVLAQLSGLDACRTGRLVMLGIRDDPVLTDGRLELIAAEGRFLSKATLTFERHLRAALRSVRIAS